MTLTRQAVVLVAGQGKRLLPFTLSNPKCFARVAGRRILENALEALAANGCETVRIVVGHHSDVVRERIGDCFAGLRIDYVENAMYSTTNSMYSLALGLGGLREPVWVLEGDVFFEPSILALPARSDIAWFVDSSARHLDGSFVESDAHGRALSQSIVRDLSLLKPNQAKSLGILRLATDGTLQMQRWLDRGIAEGRQNDYYDLIVGEHLADGLVHTVDVAGHKWFEIDTNEDLQAANRFFA